ncbi:MAG: Gfo/Idh/MocA family oxidoreductase [Chloroflexota bacterium]|nr:Gfo/Idh/MocA family oxidoreductase [Chloroflexota bacterium]MDE3101870.1 Gfo/Idh/MocA family oxidoreductase [Chloroflexota bacterium]
MTDTLKVGVIGAGYWGPNLIRNFNDAPGADVLAVADLQPQRLAPIQKRYPSIQMTTDHRSILDDPKVEAVAIATPISTHRPLCEEAFAAGKHVLVEKPLAGTVADAEAIVAAARAARRTLMVGHTFVHNPAVSAVRGIIERGDLGEIHYIDSQRVNLGLHQFDFNVLWDLGPHDVSITLYWLDQEPLWVQCVGGCYVQDDIEDVAWLTIGFPSGAIAHAHLSWLAPGKIRTMTVIGSRKMAMYDDLMPVEKVKIFDQGVERLDPDELRRAYRAGDIHSPRVPMTEALQIEVTRFVESVRTGTPSISDGEAGLRVVRVLEAASRSLRAKGARVEYAPRREAVATAAR